MDFLTKKQRSALMSGIRGHGNKATELALIKIFRSYGMSGWRRRQLIYGKPDFVFSKKRLVVFVDGCFWHSCPRHGTIPQGNRLFWKRKFSTNKRRDRIVNATLRREGWKVLRIWECALRIAVRRRLLKRLCRRIESLPETCSRIPSRVRIGPRMKASQRRHRKIRKRIKTGNNAK